MGLRTHLKIFNPELFLCKEHAGTKNGAETEGKVIQRSTLGSISHLQTQNPKTIADTTIFQLMAEPFRGQLYQDSVPAPKTDADI